MYYIKPLHDPHMMYMLTCSDEGIVTANTAFSIPARQVHDGRSNNGLRVTCIRREEVMNTLTVAHLLIYPEQYLVPLSAPHQAGSAECSWRQTGR